MTPETAQTRRGKFSASQIHRIMGGSSDYITCDFTTEHPCFEKVKKDDGFVYVPCQEAPKNKKVWKKDNSFLPSGADTYIIEKVTESLDSFIPETFTNTAMQYGIDTEPFAIEAIEAAFGITLSHTNQEQVFFSDGESGATPDGVLYGDDFITIIETHEVKCPNPATHTFNCLNVHTSENLEKHYPEYFWQCVMQMLHTGATVAFWHSYRPTHTRQLHTVKIPRDEQKIQLLQHRINLAVARKNQYLEVFK